VQLRCPAQLWTHEVRPKGEGHGCPESIILEKAVGSACRVEGIDLKGVMKKMRRHLIGDEHFFSYSQANQELALCVCDQLLFLGSSRRFMNSAG